MTQKEKIKELLKKFHEEIEALHNEGKHEEACDKQFIAQCLFDLMMLQDSMRCKFAAQMLAGFIGNSKESSGTNYEQRAEFAVKQADALIKKLKEEIDAD